jgi:hypothetical protein
LLPEFDVNLKGYKDQRCLEIDEFGVVLEPDPEYSIAAYSVFTGEKAYQK